MLLKCNCRVYTIYKNTVDKWVDFEKNINKLIEILRIETGRGK